MAKTKEVKIPKSAAACADMLHTTRLERLRLQRECDNLSELETKLKDFFIATMSKSDTTGIAGKVARVQLGTKSVPTVEDWDAFYAHVKKTGNFELMQRRLNDTAVKERWDNKKQVPGVGRFNAVTVSCTALKG